MSDSRLPEAVSLLNEFLADQAGLKEPVRNAAICEKAEAFLATLAGAAEEAPSLEEKLAALIENGLTFGQAVQAFAEKRSDRELAYVEAARESSCLREGSIEVDDTAIVSEGDPKGAYVMAWVFVYASDAGLSCDDDDEEEEGSEDAPTVAALAAA